MVWMGSCLGCDVSLSARSTSIQALWYLQELTGSAHGQEMGARISQRFSEIRALVLCGTCSAHREDTHGKNNTLPATPDVGKG